MRTICSRPTPRFMQRQKRSNLSCSSADSMRHNKPRKKSQSTRTHSEARKENGLCRNNSLPFFQRDRLIRLDAGERLLLAARPDNLQRNGVALARMTKTEGQRQFALREIACPPLDHLHQTLP